jgi:hypothetical protein
MDLKLIFDEDMPPHAAFIAVDGAECRVVVSAKVEATALVALQPEIAAAVANAIDAS